MMPVAASTPDALLAILLVDLAVITGCALALGALARRVGQTPVIGEILAGLVLGPSVLGVVPGDLDTVLFPPDVRPYLQSLASVALVLFMFGIGFDLHLDAIRRAGVHAVRIAAAAVLVPAAAAVAITPLLWAAHPPVREGVTGAGFALFAAIALSTTAFPVLARLLTESGLMATSLGSLTLVVAAMTDLVVWVGLAALTAVLGAGATGMPFGRLLLLVAAFFALLVLVIRPLLRRGLSGSWCRRYGPAGGSLLLLAALAVCAAATTQLGLHPAFGAFALGVACPRDCFARGRGGRPPALAEVGPAEGCELVEGAARTLSTAGLVLVPCYFIVTGLRVDVTSLGADGLVEVGVLLVVAAGAKIGGVVWAAARAGHDRGSAFALGLLLNTRGLTELIVLDIGRSAGVIDERLYTALVVVALLATAMTMPLLPIALRLRGKAERVSVGATATELSGG